MVLCEFKLHSDMFWCCNDPSFRRLSIAPWNAPVALALRAVAVPLICGNTVVLKSSEYSPGSQEIVVELLHEVRTANIQSTLAGLNILVI